MKTWQKTIIGVGVILLLLVGILAYFYNQMQAQSKNEDPTYWQEKISAIEARYGGDYPQDVIVFYGSSSIRKWATLEEDMAPFPVVNHGFGGSKVADAIYYADHLVFPFNPKAVVLFTGTNDINGIAGNSKSGEDVFEKAVELFDVIHTEMPDVPIYYISISPTGMRWKVWEEAHAANQLIADYAESNDAITFIDTTDALLDENGKPNSDLYGFDRLHLNADGYAVWTSIIKPILEEDLN